MKLLVFSKTAQDMAWRFGICKAIVTIVFPLAMAGYAPGVTPNPKLVALVPPGAQVVAGMNTPPLTGQPRSFLLSTHNNTIDYNDFVSLWGVDHSRAIEQIVMVSTGSGADPFAEHSLMGVGRFDQALIYRSARNAGAKAIPYRGISVLEVQPFPRERDSFHEVRWLAMIESKLAVFGTIGLVQRELDRYLGNSGADPELNRKLAHLRRDDSTWCVATMPGHDSEIQEILQIFEPRFAELLRPGDTVQFGIRYGRHVELEYEVGMASERDTDVPRRSSEPFETTPKEASLFPVADLTRVEGGVRGVLKVPRSQYEARIAEAMAGTEPRAADVSSNR
jgi:hypothetical protein